MTPRYTCMGVSLESELACPWLAETRDAPTAFLRLGPTPERLASPTVQGLRYQAAPGQLLLWMDGIARFHVTDGTNIVVELWGDITAAQPFLLGSVLGGLLYQRGLVPMHGSVVRLGDRAYAFVGPSGVGKSTLAAALCRRGGRLVSDDICAVRYDRGQAFVMPGAPRQNLWPDSLERLGESAHETFRFVPTLDKRTIRPRRTHDGGRLPLAGVFVLEARDVATVDCRPVSGRSRFFLYERNLYRPSFARGLLGTAGVFGVTTQLAQTLPLTMVTRPRHGFQLDALCDAVEAALGTAGIEGMT